MRLFIKSTVYCIAHFISLHILPLIFFLIFILFLPIFIYILLCYVLTILRRGSTCHLPCLSPSAPSSEFQESVDLSRVPSSYHQFKAVLSKSRATSLPPHCPYDCAVELLPGSCPLRDRIFSLSSPERTAMDTYIKESLAAGIIRASTSLARVGFFFLGKKDGDLRPCIDYRGLNKITVRNRYPLPLMATAFELLQGASIFTKLDLCNAYHLVRIRQGGQIEDGLQHPHGPL